MVSPRTSHPSPKIVLTLVVAVSVSVQAKDRDGWGDDAGGDGLLLSWAAQWDNPCVDTLFGEGGVTLAG